MEFACVTVAILMGAIAERGRVAPAMLFVFAWMTIVYCPLACWAWAPGGWAFKWGVMDYAGKFRFDRNYHFANTHPQAEAPLKLAVELAALRTPGFSVVDATKTCRTSVHITYPWSPLERSSFGLAG
jgi:hypothetical protein